MRFSTCAYISVITERRIDGDQLRRLGQRIDLVARNHADRRGLGHEHQVESAEEAHETEQRAVPLAPLHAALVLVQQLQLAHARHALVVRVHDRVLDHRQLVLLGALDLQNAVLRARLVAADEVEDLAGESVGIYEESGGLGQSWGVGEGDETRPNSTKEEITRERQFHKRAPISIQRESAAARQWRECGPSPTWLLARVGHRDVTEPRRASACVSMPADDRLPVPPLSHTEPAKFSPTATRPVVPDSTAE